MGKLYQETGQHLTGHYPGEAIVEIGSDRWEGSSAYFADLAYTHHMTFVSVDLDEGARNRIRKTINPEHSAITEFVCAEGTHWSENYSGATIRVLYLDNFDWDWSTDRNQTMIQQQVEWYRDRGINMNNLNCQTTHLKQMINLLPHMAEKSLVIVDDTYEYNGVFIGKGGAVVPFLLGQGFGMLATKDYGVILGRGFKNCIV